MAYILDAKLVPGSDPRVDWGGGNFPSAKFIEAPSDGLPKIGPAKAGVPVDGSELPKKITWIDKPAYPPADFDKCGQLNVSERARAVIETVEPGVHQFFPVDYYGRDGKLIETRYWLYICNRRDSVCADKSNWVLNPLGYYSSPRDALDFGWDIPAHVDVNAPAKFVFEKAKIGDIHLWREARADGLPLMSETMHRAIVDAGLTGFAPSERRRSFSRQAAIEPSFGVSSRDLKLRGRKAAIPLPTQSRPFRPNSANSESSRRAGDLNPYSAACRCSAAKIATSSSSLASTRRFTHWWKTCPPFSLRPNSTSFISPDARACCWRLPVA